MNYLEKKAIKIVQKKQNELYSKIESIRYKISSISNLDDDKTTTVINGETLIKELEALLDNDMHSISEWLHALESNHSAIGV